MLLLLVATFSKYVVNQSPRVGGYQPLSASAMNDAEEYKYV